MRILQTTISDLVQISPEDFQKLSAVAIEDNINEKYANKVGCFKLIFAAKD
jgi:DNA-directed RNA polymerase III subunit RPC8